MHSRSARALYIAAFVLVLSALAKHGLSGQVRVEANDLAKQDPCGTLAAKCALADGWSEGLEERERFYVPSMALPSLVEGIGLLERQELQDTAPRLHPAVLGGVLGTAAGAGLGLMLQSNGAKCGDTSSCVIIGGVMGLAFGVVVGLLVPDDPDQVDES